MDGVLRYVGAHNVDGAAEFVHVDGVASRPPLPGVKGVGTLLE